MNSLLVQFKNKNSSEITEKIQLDSSSNVNNLTTILNTFRATDSSYCFYFNNQRILESLNEIIERFSLTTEDLALVEYIDEKDFHADIIIDCSDTVIDLKAFEGKVFYLTFNGEVNEIEKKETVKLNIKGNRKGLEGRFSYDEFSVYDNLKESFIYSTEGDVIQCCSNFNTEMAIATESNIIILDLKDLTVLKIKENINLVRCVEMNEEFVCWFENYNQLLIFNRKTGEITELKKELSFNGLFLQEKRVFVTTANNKILEYSIKDRTTIEYSIQSRYTKDILVRNMNLLYTTQNELITCEIEENELVERNYHRVPGQINCIDKDKENVYVGNDNKIGIFKIESLFFNK